MHTNKNRKKKNVYNNCVGEDQLVSIGRKKIFIRYEEKIYPRKNINVYNKNRKKHVQCIIGFVKKRDNRSILLCQSYVKQYIVAQENKYV